jgi:dolichol-phosphate mannosyltransferase
MTENSPAGLNVVIPVYNERENILRTLAELERHTPVLTDVWIVHDTPEDTTLLALPDYKGERLRLRPCLNGFGRGCLNAIRYGLSRVEEGPAIVVMGDMSDDLRIIPQMMEAAEAGADLVCGSRYMPGGRHIGGPLFKKTLSRLAGISLQRLVRFPTHDVTNSFKLYSQRVLRAVEIESSGGFELGMEFTVKAWILGLKIVEIPSIWKDRFAGESRFRLWAWLPHYLRWYLLALHHGVWRLLRGASRPNP